MSHETVYTPVVDYDVCVIGGGPAGLIAAGTAARLGARVVLLEKNRSTGRKLLITGGGRCNVTNAEADPHRLVARYGPNAPALYSLFARFSSADMRDLLRSYGLETREEDEGRIFPVTDRAASVREVLMAYARNGNVDIMTRHQAVGLSRTGDAIESVSVADSPRPARAPGPAARGRNVSAVKARAYILATGGTSHPETGSTGDGFRWLQNLGHQVRVPEPALVPMKVREAWIASLQGVAVGDAKISAYLDRKRVLDRRGKLLFTHFGLSGPAALNMAQEVSEISQGGPVELVIDLFPDLDGGELDRRLQELLAAAGRQKLKNVLGRLLPPKCAGMVLARQEIDGEQLCHSLPRADRKTIVEAAKAIRVTFARLLGEDKAVISSGGVNPREIEFATMRSRLIRNLYVVGDLLDFQRQSGGYSLQLCWSSGYVAGMAAAETRQR